MMKREMKKQDGTYGSRVLKANNKRILVMKEKENEKKREVIYTKRDANETNKRKRRWGKERDRRKGK